MPRLPDDDCGDASLDSTQAASTFLDSHLNNRPFYFAVSVSAAPVLPVRETVRLDNLVVCSCRYVLLLHHHWHEGQSAV